MSGGGGEKKWEELRRVKTRCAEVRVVGRVEKSREEVKRVELRGGEMEQL